MGKGPHKICMNTWKTLAILVICFAVAGASGETFTKHKRWFQVGLNPAAIIAADLNGDEMPEIVTADIGTLTNPRDERPAHDQLSLLVARGDLEFEPQPQLQTDFAPYCIAVANVDALKAPDLVVGSFHAVRRRNISLFRNLREDLFEPVHFAIPPDRVLPYKRMRDGDDAPIFTTPGITSLVVRDFNGDALRDVLATGWSSDVLIFVPGEAETYFGAPVFIDADGGPRDVKAADFDNDGFDDLAVSLYAAGEVGLWQGDGKGGFAPAAHFDSRGHLPHKIQVADINGDKQIDLAVSHCDTDDSVVIFYGDGGFRFGVSQEIILGPDRDILEHEIRDMLVTDVNGDDKPDIIAACFASSQVVVLLNESADERLPQRFRQESYTYKEARPRSLCAADMDGNGTLDLAVTLWDANCVSLLLAK